MPRPCRVCTSPDRDRIDAELVQGVPNRRIGAQTGIGESCIRRHRAHHLPATLTKAADTQESTRADGLLAQVRGLYQRAVTILDTAERSGDLRAATSAIREVRGVLELMGRLVGELREGQSQVTVAVNQQVQIVDPKAAALAEFAALAERMPPSLRVEVAAWLRWVRDQRLHAQMEQIKADRVRMGLLDREGAPTRRPEPDPPSRPPGEALPGLGTLYGGQFLPPGVRERLRRWRLEPP